MRRTPVIIVGAAGRDFHNFNMLYRDDPRYEVVAFTATQIPDIAGRRYPSALAGPNHVEGIPIVVESELEALIQKHNVEDVVFSYSDVSAQSLLNIGSRAVAAGANFVLPGAERTMLKSRLPVIAIVAVRTGCGKSQTARRICSSLKEHGLRPVALRHPMPYGDLEKQKVQRFATLEDMAEHKCTIEEMEEYEPHVRDGTVVYAGVDYAAILEQAEKEADVIIWDGGNNDTSFIKPDLTVLVTDPHRAGHELSYHPGQVNLRLADVVVINKVDSATRAQVEAVRASIRGARPIAQIVEADSAVTVDKPELLKGKKVVVVEDGPTLTHGEMSFGAGVIAAKQHGAAEIVDGRPYIAGGLKETYAKYTHLERAIPAMGYGAAQIADLRETINRIPADAVVVGTPIDLTRLLDINKPVVRVGYELKEKTRPDLAEIIGSFVSTRNLKGKSA